MTRTRSRLFPAAAGMLLAASVLLSGCSAIDGLTGSNDPAAAPTASPTATETPYPSQFTRDGTFQSHIEINGMDYVYTLYPTKSTPRTNEWYPKGNKYFSFTFQVYDLNREIRDPFSTKRRAYLAHITVDSSTVTANGGRVQHPYQLDAEARTITFDPEPQSTKYGMLITSPKGAFELRNQKIRPTSDDTRGIDLHFTATVWVQDAPGSTKFVKKVIKQKVPIAIFASDEPTKVQSIPVDAN
ncbi:MAG TPA: hypothetical protein VFT70_16020 [Nocardioides sp.]|nr:hypothetical protein [Nocardioides sp.]